MQKSILKVINNYIKKNHPNASESHKQAFRNSIIYLVTGYSGGSGPSLREHLVSWRISGPEGKADTVDLYLGDSIMTVTVLYTDGTLPKAGEWGIKHALYFADPLCFRPAELYIEVLAQIAKQEHCFDNDAKDLEVLARVGYKI
jgi:hypothetical protein